MTLWIALTLGTIGTWQEAFTVEKAETVQRGGEDQLSWFVRFNQSASFDEALELSLRTNDNSGVLQACKLTDAHRDPRLWEAETRVQASLTCQDRANCTELTRAVHQMREACLDAAVARLDAGSRTAAR